MNNQVDNQDTSTTTHVGGKQTPIDPEQRKVLDETKSDAKPSAKPEANPGSGFVLVKDEPTQTDEQVQ